MKHKAAQRLKEASALLERLRRRIRGVLSENKARTYFLGLSCPARLVSERFGRKTSRELEPSRVHCTEAACGPSTFTHSVLLSLLAQPCKLDGYQVTMLECCVQRAGGRSLVARVPASWHLRIQSCEGGPCWPTFETVCCCVKRLNRGFVCLFFFLSRRICDLRRCLSECMLFRQVLEVVLTFKHQKKPCRRSTGHVVLIL